MMVKSYVIANNRLRKLDACGGMASSGRENHGTQGKVLGSREKAHGRLLQGLEVREEAVDERHRLEYHRVLCPMVTPHLSVFEGCLPLTRAGDAGLQQQETRAVTS